MPSKIFSGRGDCPAYQSNAVAAHCAAGIRELHSKGGEGHLDEQFTDLELREIAAAINTKLNEIDESFKRERALISMTSHELRRPVSAVYGLTKP
ncbi:MAG: hypothetical protein WBO06_01530, partial [Gammaproteobacteria bacterium]